MQRKTTLRHYWLAKSRELLEEWGRDRHPHTRAQLFEALVRLREVQR